MSIDVTPEVQRDRPSMGPDGRPISLGIAGVELHRMTRHVDHRGSLIELINFDHPFWREPIVHCEYVTTRPGRIKGWGMHKLSDDRYFVGDGRMRVVLYDGRVDSESYEQYAQFHFTEEAPGLLRIPAGVWHANQNWGDRDATFLNFPTRPHDHRSPDKYRVDPMSDEIPFDWTLREG